MLCLNCGKREQYADNLCETCLLERFEPFTVPKVIHGTVCPSCNRVLKGRHWESCRGEKDDACLEVAGDHIKLDPELSFPSMDLHAASQDGRVFHVTGEISGTYRGLAVRRQLDVEVRLDLTICRFCSRQHGNYFEAIVQIRGLEGLSEDTIEELLDSVRDRAYEMSVKDPNVFITKEEKVRGGYDFYLGEKSFAKALAQRMHDSLGGEMKVSSSLYGKRDGNDLYRFTYLVRLPGFIAGDYLILGDGPKEVLRFVKKKVFLRDLRTKRTTSMDQTEAMGRRVVRARDADVDLVVVMDAGTEVQVLHPDTLRPVDVVKPEGYGTVEDDSIPGVLIDQEVYLR